MILQRFLRAQGGASAVEFALIAPVLAAALLGIIEFGHVVYQRTDMHSALRSGGQYVLNGGRDLDTAEAIVQRSWTSRPEDGLVSVRRYCLCETIEHACTSPCADNSVPEAYISIDAQATLGGVIVGYGEEANDAIRIR